jgi:hypothetical protein
MRFRVLFFDRRQQNGARSKFLGATNRFDRAFRRVERWSRDDAVVSREAFITIDLPNVGLSLSRNCAPRFLGD